MNRVLAAALALLTACTAPSCTTGRPAATASRPAPPTSDVAREVTATVAASSGDSVGTAWLAQEDALFSYWLTAGHVCEGNHIITLRVGEDDIVGVVTSVSEEPDACLLTAEKVGLKPIPFAALEPAVGDELHYVGNPLGAMDHGFIPLFFGRAAGSKGLDQFVAIPGWPGASGSAILNEHGEVVGLLYAVTRAFPNLVFAVRLSALREFLVEAGVTPA